MDTKKPTLKDHADTLVMYAWQHVNNLEAGDGPAEQMHAARGFAITLECFMGELLAALKTTQQIPASSSGPAISP